MTVKKVYFNSACPVCNAGIKGQREKMAGCAIEWVDINDDREAVAARGVGIEDVRRKLHVEDERGALHVGADAFTVLWRETPGQRWGARVAALPGIATLARWAYDGFAALLYRWNRARGRW